MKNLWLILASLVALASCASNNAAPSADMEEVEAAPYVELAFEGRIYVMGSEKMTAKYHPHLPYTKTYLGLGPNGETVVLENEKKGTTLKARLIGQFCVRNQSTNPVCEGAQDSEEPYLTLFEDGRLYVVGSEKMLAKYHPHLPYTKTYLGLGAKGETVVLENEKKGTTLKGRLIADFCTRNKPASPVCP